MNRTDPSSLHLHEMSLAQDSGLLHHARQDAGHRRLARAGISGEEHVYGRARHLLPLRGQRLQGLDLHDHLVEAPLDIRHPDHLLQLCDRLVVLVRAERHLQVVDAYDAVLHLVAAVGQGLVVDDLLHDLVHGLVSEEAVVRLLAKYPLQLAARVVYHVVDRRRWHGDRAHVKDVVERVRRLAQHVPLEERNAEHHEEGAAQRVEAAQAALDLRRRERGLACRYVDVEHNLGDAVAGVGAAHVLRRLQQRLPRHAIAVRCLLLPLRQEDVLAHRLLVQLALHEPECLVQPRQRGEELRAPVPRVHGQQQVLVPQRRLDPHLLERRDHLRGLAHVRRQLAAVLDRHPAADVLQRLARIHLRLRISVRPLVGLLSAT